MNTKWLLLFILVLNIFCYIYGSQVCASFNSDSMASQAVDYFYDYGPLKSAYQQCRANLASGITGVNSSGIIPTGTSLTFASTTSNNTNGTFISNAQSATTASSGVVGAFVGGGLAFLDLIKLIISFAAMLIGLPVMALLAGLGVNPFVVWILIPGIETFFVIGVLEFMRGSSF